MLSVLVLFGPVIIDFIFYLLISIFLKNYSKVTGNKIVGAWIPFYHLYLLFKTVANKKIGYIITLVTIICFIKLNIIDVFNNTWITFFGVQPSKSKTIFERIKYLDILFIFGSLMYLIIKYKNAKGEKHVIDN